MPTTQQLIDIYHDTMKICKTNPLYNTKSASNFYESPSLNKIKVTKLHPKTTIEVVNDDVLQVAKQNNDGHLLILNLADFQEPGGSVMYGAMTQEEEIFRRSNYFLSLDDRYYPLPRTSVIYTHKIKVIKDQQYRLLETPFDISAIAAAAILNPQIENKQLCERDYKYTLYTLNNVLKTCYFHGHETLVLGAFGCGAFHNPPMEIIRIYNTLLEKYNGCFKKIIFAIYSRNDNNFELFNNHIFRGEL